MAGFNTQNALNALLGIGVGAQSRGALVPQFGQLVQQNQQQDLLNQVAQSGGVNSPFFQQLQLTNPELAARVLKTQNVGLQNQAAQTNLESAQLQLDQRRQQAEQRETAKAQRAEFFDPSIDKQRQEQLIAEAFVENPQEGERLLQSIGLIDQRSRNEAAEFGLELKETPFNKRPKLIEERVRSLESRGLDAKDTRQLIGLNKTDQDGIINTVIMASLPVTERAKIAAGLSNLNKSSKKIFAPVELEEGGLGTPIVDKITGEVTLERIPGAVGETPAQETQRKVEEATKKARAQQQVKDETKARQFRVDNANQSRRLRPNIVRLLGVLDDVETGKFAQAKRTFGRFLPGVDIADEEALNTELNRLIFDELAKFKGATSEKELAFASETTGSLGTTTAGNRRILEGILTRLDDPVRELDEFNKFVKDGGKAEDFVFSGRTAEESAQAQRQAPAQINQGTAQISEAQAQQLRQLPDAEIRAQAQRLGIPESEIRRVLQGL